MCKLYWTIKFASNVYHKICIENEFISQPPIESLPPRRRLKQDFILTFYCEWF